MRTPIPDAGFDSFFAVFAKAILARVALEYRDHGRGVLVMGFRKPESPIPSGRYVGLAEARAVGFSNDILEAIEAYNPDTEAVVFMNCVTEARLLRLSIEQDNSSSMN